MPKEIYRKPPKSSRERRGNDLLYLVLFGLLARELLKPGNRNAEIVRFLREYSATLATSIHSMPPPANFLNPTVTAAPSDHEQWWQKDRPLLRDWPFLQARADILPWLEKLGFTRGVEVGVQRGLLARQTLSVWKSCREYQLIDLWGSDPHYTEPGRDSNAVKNEHLANARRILKSWTDRNITEFRVMRSADAAPRLPNGHYDYVYIDARHDYCAVQEDMDAYWPKVRPGGILAGHDFIDAPSAMAILGPTEDWSKCEDGRVRPRAVRGAVEDFAAKHGLNFVTTHEGFDSWLIQKPYETNAGAATQ